MGNFYVNHTVLTPDNSALMDGLRSLGRSAFVGKTVDGMTLFFDEESDTQNDEVIRAVGADVTSSLKCPVLAVLNHDDDILCYWLFDSGNVVDEYNSCPGYFSGEDTTPSGGDAHQLAAAFNVPNSADEIASILKNEEYVFALERHEALVKLLRIPWQYACVGYAYLAAEEYPDDLSADDFVRVS